MKMIGAHMTYITWVAKIRWPEPWKNGQATKLRRAGCKVSCYGLAKESSKRRNNPGVHLEVSLAEFSIKMFFGDVSLLLVGLWGLSGCNV